MGVGVGVDVGVCGGAGGKGRTEQVTGQRGKGKEAERGSMIDGPCEGTCSGFLRFHGTRL